MTLLEIARVYWPILACSLAVSLLATPLCRRYALKKNIVDRPDDWLKPHRKPIPYFGGVAIFLGWAAGIIWALVLLDTAPVEVIEPSASASMDRKMMIGILIAGGAIMLLGLFDDLRLASPWVKLMGGAAVALLLVIAGLGDDTIVILLRSTGIHVRELQGWLVLVYSIPLTVLIVLGACNATNLIDGVDGLCSGVLGIIAAGFLVLAVNLHMWRGWHPWDSQRVVLSLAMMGAALGFLPYNRNPAKVFMGDAGSMLLGLNCAVILLLFAKSATMRWMFGAIMVFGLPLADTALALARRWRNQKPIMLGDRSHFYDQLIDRGWPVKRVVKVSYALAVVFALLGCVVIFLRLRYLVLLYALVVLAIAVTIKKFKMVRLESPRDGSHSRRGSSSA